MGAINWAMGKDDCDLMRLPSRMFPRECGRDKRLPDGHASRRDGPQHAGGRWTLFAAEQRACLISAFLLSLQEMLDC